MFERAILIRASSLVPLYTITPWNETYLSFDSGCGRLGSARKVPSNPLSVGLQAFTVQVPAHSGNKEVIFPLLSAFIGSMILVQIMGYSLTVLDLIIEQCFQY